MQIQAIRESFLNVPERMVVKMQIQAIRESFWKANPKTDQTLKTGDKTQSELRNRAWVVYCCELQEQKEATYTINCPTKKFQKTL